MLWSSDDDPSYNSLTPQEFVAGFMSITEESLPVMPETADTLKLIHYLRNMMEDCPSAGWTAVKQAHRQVLNAIEYKRLRWEDTEAVYNTKRTALLRAVHQPAETPVIQNLWLPHNSAVLCPRHRMNTPQSGNPIF